MTTASMTTPGERLWRAARKLGRTRRRRKTLPPLLFFTDPARTPDPASVLGRLPRGSAIVFRAFGAATAVTAGRQLARLARNRGVIFFVGADPALAAALRADGLHLPERMAHRAGVVRRLTSRFLVTAAAHDEAAVRRASRSGVDAVVVSPVFPSASPSAGRPLGPLRFAAIVHGSKTPVYALGGVNATSARRLAGSGAVGLAAVGAFAAPGGNPTGGA